LKIKEIKEILNAEILTGEEYLDREVKYAFSSDLMSDILACVNSETILLTGLNNPQIMKAAEMVDLSAIVFVRGKRPASTIIEIAKKKNFVIMFTEETMYTASGKLYKENLEGLTIKKEVGNQ
jgi:predicted transcriptional regulator